MPDQARAADIITECDYARKVILHGRASPTTRVEEIMTSHVAYTHLDQSIEECMAIMTDKRIRHLPGSRWEIYRSHIHRRFSEGNYRRSEVHH